MRPAGQVDVELWWQNRTNCRAPKVPAANTNRGRELRSLFFLAALLPRKQDATEFAGSSEGASYDSKFLTQESGEQIHSD